jgi:hypothetical protein
LTGALAWLAVPPSAQPLSARARIRGMREKDWIAFAAYAVALMGLLLVAAMFH